MATSAASLVKSVTAFSSELEASFTINSTDVAIRLSVLTDEISKKVPLKAILDNMTYAQDVFEESTSKAEGDLNAPEEDGLNAPEEGGLSVPEEGDLSVPESADIKVGVTEISEDIPEPVHKRGDKVELDEKAEYIWIGNERFSLSDEDAVVDLFVEDGEDEYILEKDISVGSAERLDPNNKFYNAVFVISTNRWSFNEFEFYTVDVNDEKTSLEAKIKEIGFNSCEFTIASPLEQGKNVYLDAVPCFMKDGDVFSEVEISVDYHGQNPKNDCILTDGQITIDFRAIDEEGNIITEQKDFTVVIFKEDESVPDESVPNESEPAQVPDETTTPVAIVPVVELDADCGSEAEIFFDDISGDKFEVNITGSPLENIDARLSGAVNVALGDVEVSDDGAKIVLNAVKDVNSDFALGDVLGKLIITADNAEPLTIELSGHSDFVRIVEHTIPQTAMKYIPYWAEYGLDCDYPWLSAEFAVIGELRVVLNLTRKAASSAAR